ncbi:hypothetical protein TWF718_006795 [Orbilia javanica]|uniref:F-box domain-containing protein n=1 Tax=Orbilia javanica TaxID=47235 RepID=A0AAN8MXE1_9PEZI
MPLTSLPIEIIGEILCQIDDRESLKSTITCCRQFYAAYQEYRETVNHACWRNSYASCEIYCKFLTHAVVNFLPIKVSGGGIPGEDVFAFWAAYMAWLKPPDVSAPIGLEWFRTAPAWEKLALMPDPLSKDMAETHKYVFSWSKKFCTDRLRYHGLTREEMSTNLPPTRSELTRVCTAFYQFWIYCILCNLPAVGLSDYFQIEVGSLGSWDDSQAVIEIITRVVEAMDFKEFVMVRNSLIPWVRNYAKVVVKEVVPGYENSESYKLEGYLGHSWTWGDTSLQHVLQDGNSLMWSLFCELGPKGFWKFLFESAPQQQNRISLTHPHRREYGSISAPFREYEDYSEAKRLFPILRICKGRLELTEGDACWWHFKAEEFVDKSVIMWDDWRLKEWGFTYPVLVPDVFWAEISGWELDAQKAAQ